MTYGFSYIGGDASTGSSSPSSSVKNTCWVSVAIIVGVLIFILIINDLFMRKQVKCKKLQKNVKFYDEDDHYDQYNQYEQENIVPKLKSSCSLNH